MAGRDEESFDPFPGRVLVRLFTNVTLRNRGCSQLRALIRGADEWRDMRANPCSLANRATPLPDEKMVTGCELDLFDNLIRE